MPHEPDPPSPLDYRSPRARRRPATRDVVAIVVSHAVLALVGVALLVLAGDLIAWPPTDVDLLTIGVCVACPGLLGTLCLAVGVRGVWRALRVVEPEPRVRCVRPP